MCSSEPDGVSLLRRPDLGRRRVPVVLGAQAPDPEDLWHRPPDHDGHLRRPPRGHLQREASPQGLREGWSRRGGQQPEGPRDPHVL